MEPQCHWGIVVAQEGAGAYVGTEPGSQAPHTANPVPQLPVPLDM